MNPQSRQFRRRQHLPHPPGDHGVPSPIQIPSALTFILGVLPLVIASGAGAESRIALGTTVFAGMLVATILSVFFVPTLYAIVQRTKERFVKA